MHSREYPPLFCPMAEMEARFSLLDSQMKELREENSRLTNDVSNFTILMSEREDEESCQFALKTPLSVLSSTGHRRSPYRMTPSKLGSNLDTCNGDITFQSTRIFGLDKSISRNWSEINPMFASPVSRLFTPPGDDERLNESSGESKISHTMLLQQLTNIQSQLDVIRKQLTGSPTRRSAAPSVPNPFISDNSLKNFNSPIPEHTSTSKSTPYLSTSLPACTSVTLNFPSDEVKTPPRIDYYPGYRDSDFDKNICETAWISNPLGFNENFKSNENVSGGVSRFIYPASERIVRVQSKKYGIDDESSSSSNGLITAASRCLHIANRDPANSDLSTALDKYLNVVKKLSSSASKLDSRLEKEMGMRGEDKKTASDFFKPIFL